MTAMLLRLGVSVMEMTRGSERSAKAWVSQERAASVA